MGRVGVAMRGGGAGGPLGVPALLGDVAGRARGGGGVDAKGGVLRPGDDTAVLTIPNSVPAAACARGAH